MILEVEGLIYNMTNATFAEFELLISYLVDNELNYRIIR